MVRRLRIGIGLAFPALLHLGGWPEISAWNLVGTAFLALFELFVALALLDHVLRQREVGREVIAGVCSAYLMLGAAFASAYQLVFAFDANAFSLAADLPVRELFSNTIYLSYVTLTTLGYGDLLPLYGVAQSLASLEAIVGVLFPSILIARLVSLYGLSREAT